MGLIKVGQWYLNRIMVFKPKRNLKCDGIFFDVVFKPDDGWIVVFEPKVAIMWCLNQIVMFIPKGNINVVFETRVMIMWCFNQGNSVQTKMMG